jgi:prepilin-type N-terminal cleavage/methylation domain-containing protein
MIYKNKLSKVLGFTLIEILFVITILGVMATLGLTLLQQNTVKTKIDKTALQMQQIFQAGLQYYSDQKSTWPDANLPSPTYQNYCSLSPLPKFCNYLPVDSQNTPFGKFFYWTPVGVSATAQKFRICGPLVSKQIAQRIVSLLPGGRVSNACNNSLTIDTCSDSDPGCYPIAEVSTPSGGGSGGAGSIVGFGTFPLDKAQYEVADFCPIHGGDCGGPEFGGKLRKDKEPSIPVNCSATGGTPHLLAYPLSYKLGYQISGTVKTLFALDLKPNCTTDTCSLDVTFQHRITDYMDPEPAISNNKNPGANNGYLVIGYIAYCK